MDKSAANIGDIQAKAEALRQRLSRMQIELATVLCDIGDLVSAANSVPVEREVNAAAAIGFKGDQSGIVYQSFIGSEQPFQAHPGTIPFTSTICRQVHFTFDQYRFWVKALKDRPRFLRKQWEFVYIAQALFERDCLRSGRKGLGFGVGLEPLPALFASFGAAVTATDQGAEDAARAGWTRTSEHSVDLSRLNDRGICTERMFSELVDFRSLDMNEITTDLYSSYDFCWSSCCLEHLGSIRHGLMFIENSLQTLKPGGIAVHTTEFNLSSNEDTIESRDLSIYRRQDIERLIADLEEKGHSVEPVDWQSEGGLVDRVVDLPPYGRGEPHIRLRLGNYDATSIGLIIRKAS